MKKLFFVGIGLLLLALTTTVTLAAPNCSTESSSRLIVAMKPLGSKGARKALALVVKGETETLLRVAQRCGYH